MRKLKIIVNCPGFWSHGLNSPERGEGRWAQNWAKTLAKYGHEVYAASAGFPLKTPHYGVNIINDGHMREVGEVDLYIDAAWWEDKEQHADFKHSIRIHWGFEQHLKKEIPKTQAIVFPYMSSTDKFIHDENPHKDRTFLMPIPLCDKFSEPAFDHPDFLIPTQASPCKPLSFKNAKVVVDEVYGEYVRGGEGINVHWLFWDQVKHMPHVQTATTHTSTRSYTKIPYNQVRDIISSCKVSFPFNSPACAIDSTALGVPSLTWERGSFFSDVADNLGLRIGKEEETPERIKEVIKILMTDRKKYTQFVLDMQKKMEDHTEEKAMEHFNLGMERLGVF